MNPTEQKTQIEQHLAAFRQGTLAVNATALLGTLGYRSDKTLTLAPNNAQTFLETFAGGKGINREKARMAEWETVDLLFQLTDAEIGVSGGQSAFDFDSAKRLDNARIESYLFFAIGLKASGYTRTQLADITREVNKLFAMPAMLLFRHGQTLTLAVIDRRLHKRDESRDVLEKVTLIKDIRIANPHRAHIEILFDLSLARLCDVSVVHNFVELHAAWRKSLDSSALNKRFYQEVANWYFWALQHVRFPAQQGVEEEVNRATGVIRLITRLIFTWFVKEKGLVPEDLFLQSRLSGLLADLHPDASSFYKAILQNLFFATLNTEMNATDRPRKFRGKRKEGEGRDPHFMVHNVYRYEDHFQDPEAALAVFASVPFLNGGLFECLDTTEEREGRQVTVRVDGFSDRPDNPLHVPNFLFFSEERVVDLNDVYGTRSRTYKVRGLLEILHAYKFTINENTPIEEEIALDPELLGRVFENLLASYNPETKATARKQTGSFYTPREIVNYMVDEALIAALETPLTAIGAEAVNARLRHLFAYTDEPHRFCAREVNVLIEAMDGLKILDPACGSGAFPMGMLHKLVFLLDKLDPHNAKWKDEQIARARKIMDAEARDRAIVSIEQAFEKNELDYGRKLYLIEHCLYGVDIQPIAMQIAKLRFFISLIIDQRIDPQAENLGIRPLPNLETKFVAANTLLGIKKPGQMRLRSAEIDRKEEDLKQVREQYFTARTPRTKQKWRQRDEELRAEIGLLLEEEDFPPETTEKLARWNPYDQNQTADFFDSEWMFGITDGFDITIGNPPYVRADAGEVHIEMRRQIEGSGLYETLWEKWDLYIPFIERGYKLLKPDGVTTMIVSDAFCHSKYAQKSQKWFLQNSRIRRLDFFTDVQIFEAAVHNVIYLFKKSDGAENEPERRVHNPEFGVVTLLPTVQQREATYRTFFPEGEAIEAFSKPTLLLSDILYITKGMVVHAHEEKAPGAFELADLVADQKDSLHSKPFVEGKHLARWLPSTHKWLEWGSQRAPALFSRPTFPQLYEVPEKLISVDMSAGVGQLRVAYDNQPLYHNHSAWSFIPWHSLAGVRNNSLKKATRYRGEKPPRHDLPRREDLEAISRRFAVKYLLAVMNSNAARDFLRANRRSNIHLYPEDWKQLPVPDVSLEEQTPLVELVDQILTTRRADRNADVRELEKEIDKRVAALYGLQGLCQENAT
jgi:adenine-specific DNA-methyltransferase